MSDQEAQRGNCDPRDGITEGEKVTFGQSDLTPVNRVNDDVDLVPLRGWKAAGCSPGLQVHVNNGGLRGWVETMGPPLSIPRV